MKASGEFRITLAPVPTEVDSGAISLTHISKEYIGDMVGTSVGMMLAFRAATPGSAGYVAMEELAVEVHARKGSLVLQHTGTMQNESASLTVIVVPGSGGGELTGITGQLGIDIRDGVHYYEFDYDILS